MHMDEIIAGKRLPIKYAGYSPCFRKEAGAHGRDMKGIFRVHQFEKVEQFVYCRPEESWKEHEKMLTLSEEFFNKLGIPHRVMLLCSGDTGKISAKTYDIEAWMAGQNAYREIVSCSNCADYQSRRYGSISRRDERRHPPVHTLKHPGRNKRTMVRYWKLSLSMHRPGARLVPGLQVIKILKPALTHRILSISEKK